MDEILGDGGMAGPEQALSPPTCTLNTANVPRVLMRVRDFKELPGSLNAMWPSGPIPPMNKFMPPAAAIWRGGGEGDEEGLENAKEANNETANEHPPTCLLLVCPALLRKGSQTLIADVTVQHVDILGLDVHVIEEIIVHEGVIAFRVLTRKTNVLIHVERDNVLKAHFPGLVHRNERLISRNGGRSGRQPKHKLGAIAAKNVQVAEQRGRGWANTCLGQKIFLRRSSPRNGASEMASEGP